MAINFYSSIDLNQNELQNTRVQNAGSDPTSPTPVAGQIYYNSGDNTLRFHNGTSFQTLSTSNGDITGVTAGTGLTGGGSSGAVTLNVIGGNGITANADEIVITPTQTTITSLLNTSLVVGRDADNQIKFGTDNQMIFRVGAGDGVVFKASGEIEATSLDISGDVDVDGTLEADAITLNGTPLGGLSIRGTVDTVHIEADAVTGAKIADNSIDSEHYVDGSIDNAHLANNAVGPDELAAGAADTKLTRVAISTQTDLGANFASGDSLLVLDTSASALKEGTIGNLQTYMQNNLTFTTNTNDDVSNANLLTRLAALESAGGAADQQIIIGTDSGDTIVIAGNLQVSGTTTTVESNTVEIGDHNILLDADNTTSAVVDGAGITIEGGSGDDAAMVWDASSQGFRFKLGSNLTRVYGSFQGDLVGSATSAATASTANVATNITTVANNSNNEAVYPTFVDGATGQQSLETDTALHYNPSSNVLTVGSVSGNLTGAVTGNASTATALATSRNLQVDLTSTSAQGFTGAANATSIGVSGVLPTANTAAKVTSIVAGAGIDVSGATGDVTVTAETATKSNAGIVELASSSETQTGTDSTRAVTPDGLAARMVVADIDVSSLTDANIVTITHNLGTADVMVQVYDKTTEANIMCDIARTTDDFATASTSVVSIDFGTAPPNDCRALITSLKGATASGTVAYT